MKAQPAGRVSTLLVPRDKLPQVIGRGETFLRSGNQQQPDAVSGPQAVELVVGVDGQKENLLWWLVQPDGRERRVSAFGRPVGDAEQARRNAWVVASSSTIAPTARASHGLLPGAT